MKTYTAAIIGCGSIGTSKDDRYDSLTSENILTHAHSVFVHPRTDLVAVVDTDKDKREVAARKWDSVPLADISAIARPDIIIIATPTETHHSVLLKALACRPHLVIAEKPFCDNSTQAKEVINAYEAANVPLLVNYIRRFVPEFQAIKTMIQTHELGAVQGCRVIYNRGLKREGSHALDLMHWFFGDRLGGHIERPIHALTDYSEADPTYAVYLEYKYCPHVFMFPADGRRFSIFEVDILFEGGRLSLIEHGLKYKLYPIEPEPVYGDYMTLSYTGEAFQTSLNTALFSLIDNVVNHLDSGEPLLCTGREAMRVHQVLERLL